MHLITLRHTVPLVIMYNYPIVALLSALAFDLFLASDLCVLFSYLESVLHCFPSGLLSRTLHGNKLLLSVPTWCMGMVAIARLQLDILSGA